MKENDGKIEEKAKIRALLYFSKNLFSVNFISRKKRSIMMKRIFIPFVSLVMALGFLAACSNDSNSANSTVSAPNVAAVTKFDSISYVASEGSCGSARALTKSAFMDDSVHLYMNKDGSAVLKERMPSICPENGEITKISLEKLDDTLQVFMTVYEKRGPTRKCGGCYSDFEIEVPADFAGVKYIALTSSATEENTHISYNMEKSLLYFVSYMKE
jgi:hypothetical protein